MIPKIIVGFGHRSGVGKDTVAKFVDTKLRVARPGLIVKKVSFAWKLKEMAYDLYHWAGVQRPSYYENNRDARALPLKALGGMTVVDLWVKLGECVRNEVYIKTWIDFAIRGHHDPIDVLLVPDVRNPEETDEIEVLGGLLVKVENPRVPHREGISIDDKLEAFTGWHTTFVNDAGLQEVNDFAVDFAARILERYDAK